MVIFMIFASPQYLSRVKGYSQLFLCEARNWGSSVNCVNHQPLNQCFELNSLSHSWLECIEIGYESINRHPNEPSCDSQIGGEQHNTTAHRNFQRWAAEAKMKVPKR